MKDLFIVKQNSGNYELAISKVPSDFYNEKEDFYQTEFEIRLVDSYVMRKYGREDEFTFVFEIRN
jgi:hypothetical protein